MKTRHLWFMLIPGSFWALGLVHKFFDLSLRIDAWYSFPLFITYCVLIVAGVFVAVGKGID